MGILANRGELLASLLTFLLSGLDQKQNDLGTIPKIRQERGKGKGVGEPLGCHRGLFVAVFIYLFLSRRKM